MHVRNTDGNGHGPYGEVPDEFNVQDAPIVGQEQESQSFQQTVKEAPNRILLCNYCGKGLRGERGLSIHLGKSKGDEKHPASASISDGNYSRIPADEDYNPLIDEDTVERIREKEMEDTQKAMQQFEVVEESDSEPMTPEEISKAREKAATDLDNLSERLSELYIPTHVQKTKQVASLIEQEPALYNRPEEVRDLVDCSRTTFYEGRKLYDMNAEVQTEPEVTESKDAINRVKESIERREGEPHSVIVDGVKMVPVRELEEINGEIEERIEKYN